MSKIKQYVSAAPYLIGWKFIKIIPSNWVIPISNFAGKELEKRKQFTQLRKNLGVIAKHQGYEVDSQLVAKSLSSYFRYWLEIFRLENDSKNIENLVEVIGIEKLQSGLDKGKGVLLLLPHSANWDLAGAWLINNFANFATVAEALEPKIVYDAFVDFRTKLGMKIFSNKDHPYQKLIEELNNNNIICLMSDRDLSKFGIEVKFFGEETKFPPGPAKLYQDTDCVAMPVTIRYNGEKLFLVVEDPIEIDNINDFTQQLANQFEKQISISPWDWHMMQPLWKSDWRSE